MALPLLNDTLPFKPQRQQLQARCCPMSTGEVVIWHSGLPGTAASTEVASRWSERIPQRNQKQQLT